MKLLKRDLEQFRVQRIMNNGLNISYRGLEVLVMRRKQRGMRIGRDGDRRVRSVRRAFKGGILRGYRQYHNLNSGPKLVASTGLVITTKLRGSVMRSE